MHYGILDRIVLDQANEVYQSTFWMILHGCGSPKPTICFSPMKTIEQLNLGKLTKQKKQELTTLVTVRVWTTCSAYGTA